MHLAYVNLQLAYFAFPALLPQQNSYIRHILHTITLGFVRN